MNNKLKLNAGIFSLSVIEQAVFDYKNICDIILTQNQKYYVCEFLNCKFTLKTTICEFENYIIDLMNVVK